MPETIQTVKLRGTISTTHYGHEKLIALYYQCNKYSNIPITVCFKDLIWIDANMAALLQAIVKKLEKENNLELLADLTESTSDFGILFRNGLFESNELGGRDTGTTIRLKEFLPHHEDEFVRYIEVDFIDFPKLTLTEYSKDVIVQSLIEIFTNYEIHSKANYPIFLCGQYYPVKKLLKFTIVDLGIGFLDPIKLKVPQIDTYEKAINWAMVEGNTTKQDAPGGLGLWELRESMEENNGYLEIVSGNAYKACGIKNGIRFENCKTLRSFHVGTTINLVFNGV
ncbi:hypothetical protein [Maribacter polysaccharolyticus]|uniref:hypothetical protein n=1 Tax=Maribacter polysaccharolyticus TaxID=3020831 RepID=UPI00237F906B|nr:hypothetical protein [Maribacter polysaccharolyticus]MDE3744077.1 hypothetical protein [Maribacter polysaccharolyticus]